MNLERDGKSPPHYTGFDELPINGRWRRGKGAKVLRDLDPYNGEILVEIQQANQDDMEEAYSGAAQAYRAWAALLPGERADVMRRAAQVMEARREEIVSWLIRETGARGSRPTSSGKQCMGSCLRQRHCRIWSRGVFCRLTFPERKAGCIASR